MSLAASANLNYACFMNHNIVKYKEAKPMKRILSVVLALLTALALPTAAFAATPDATAAANTLHELGLFQGSGTNADGTPNYDLDRSMTRHEAVTMLVRLLGKEDEAKAGNWTIPFTDVADWARPYVGYAYANGLANGVDTAAFGGSQTVNAAQYLTFTLRALGYESGTDFQWNAAWELTDYLGITSGQYGSGSAFTRGDVAVVSCNALGAYPKGSSYTLLETLNGTASGRGVAAPANEAPAPTPAADPAPAPAPAPASTQPGANTQNNGGSSGSGATARTAIPSEATYVLNVNSKKFHYPDCASVDKMSPKNRKDFSGSRDEIIQMGYEPCKNCNP